MIERHKVQNHEPKTHGYDLGLSQVILGHFVTVLALVLALALARAELSPVR